MAGPREGRGIGWAGVGSGADTELGEEQGFKASIRNSRDRTWTRDGVYGRFETLGMDETLRPGPGARTGLVVGMWPGTETDLGMGPETDLGTRMGPGVGLRPHIGTVRRLSLYVN